MSVAKNQTTAVSKPVVWIYTAATTQDENVKSIQLGLEEEGIPFEVLAVAGVHSAHELSTQAAKASSLGVGIGLVDSAHEAALHHRDLRKDEMLIEIHKDIFTPNSLRRLGANSARIVKGTPMISVVEDEAKTTVSKEYPQPAITDCDTKENAQFPKVTQPVAPDAEVDLELLVNVVIEVIEIINSGEANV